MLNTVIIASKEELTTSKIQFNCQKNEYSETFEIYFNSIQQLIIFCSST